jgi:hypothetical protein
VVVERAGGRQSTHECASQADAGPAHWRLARSSNRRGLAPSTDRCSARPWAFVAGPWSVRGPKSAVRRPIRATRHSDRNKKRGSTRPRTMDHGQTKQPRTDTATQKRKKPS